MLLFIYHIIGFEWTTNEEFKMDLSINRYEIIFKKTIENHNFTKVLENFNKKIQ